MKSTEFFVLNLALADLPTLCQTIRDKNIVSSSGHRTQAFDVTFRDYNDCSNSLLAYKSESLRSFNGHALLILAESTKSKSQLGHQQFELKDPSINTCQVISVSIVFKCYTRGLGSMSTGDKYFFSSFI